MVHYDNIHTCTHTCTHTLYIHSFEDFCVIMGSYIIGVTHGMEWVLEVMKVRADGKSKCDSIID